MSVNKQKINVEPSQEITQELRQLIKLGQFKDAEIKAKQLNIRHSNSSTILNLIGVSLIAQHKFDEAEKNFNKLIKIKPDFAEAYNNLANIYMNTQKIKKAIKYFDKAITLKSDLNQAHFNLSKIYTDIGNSFQRKGEITESIINYKK